MQCSFQFLRCKVFGIIVPIKKNALGAQLDLSPGDIGQAIGPLVRLAKLALGDGALDQGGVNAKERSGCPLRIKFLAVEFLRFPHSRGPSKRAASRLRAEIHAPASSKSPALGSD